MADDGNTWRVFWRDRPGRRFERRYERTRGEHVTPARRVARVASGSMLVAVGIVFLPLPGPGFIPIAFGGAILAGESLRIAQLADRCEMRVRRLLRR
jgi:hypothetical protein